MNQLSVDSSDIDMHLHSIFSDGDLWPEGLIEECKKAGKRVVSLTDHETTKGVPPAKEAGKKLGIKVISGGIEILTGYERKEEHLLGYWFDAQNPLLDNFLEKYKEIQLKEIERATIKLQRIGFKVEFEEVLAVAVEKVTWLHVSLVMFNKPENSPLLKEYGIEKRKDIYKTFSRQGIMVYSDKAKPSIKEAIDLIDELSGISVWAHPFERDSFSEIKEKAAIFRKMGLDGLEVCYSKHSREQALFLHRVARDNLMLETIGSDFHLLSERLKIPTVETFGLKLNLSPLLFV